MVDTHCHVHFNAYKDDMDAVIRRTLEKGVRMITVGTQSTTSKNGIEVAERYDGVYATIGLHPNHTCEQEFFDTNELNPEKGAVPEPVAGQEWHKVKTRCETFDVAYYRKLAEHPKVVAIGECGLDYYRIPEHLNVEEVKETQKREVRLQLELANEVGLPVVIHCRDAHADMVEMLKALIAENKLERRGVIHCFTGTLEEARAYHEIGFLTSFTGVITFPPRKGQGDISPLQQVVKECPLEMMMIETDAPYLTPEPHRGKRNEPWYVEFVAQKIADLKGIDIEEVKRVTTTNAERLFGLK